MKIAPFRTPVLFTVAAIALAGCGKLFQNDSDPVILGELNDPNAGVEAAATETVTPNGRDLAILSFSSIGPVTMTTDHTATNEIVLGIKIRSEKDEYSAVHLRELGHLSSGSGIYSLDSALGCHYSMANPGTPRAYLKTLTGSCVSELTVELPDHDIPRAFLGTTPLFVGEIALADLKAVYAAEGNDPKIAALLRTYVARLPAAVKPLTVADVAGFMIALGNDTRRIDAVATLAPRVSDAANAENLPANVFTTAANRDRAVKILAAFR